MAAAWDDQELQLAMAATRKRRRCSSWGADEQEMLQLMLNRGQGRRQVTTCNTTRSSAMAMAMNASPHSCDCTLARQYEVPRQYEPAVDCIVDVDSHSALPPGWKRCLDLKSGSMYLFNWSTGASVPCNTKNSSTYKSTQSSSSTSGQYSNSSTGTLLSYSACQPASPSSKASDTTSSWSCPAAISKLDKPRAPKEEDLQLRLGPSPAADPCINSSLAEDLSHAPRLHRQVAPLACNQLSEKPLSGRLLCRDAAPAYTKSRHHHHVGASREVPFIIDDEDHHADHSNTIHPNDGNGNDNRRMNGLNGHHTDKGNIYGDANDDNGKDNRRNGLSIGPRTNKGNWGNGNYNDSRGNDDPPNEKELPNMVAQGCSKCLMLIMLSPDNPRCPNCGTSNPIDFLPSHNSSPSSKLDREKMFGFAIKNSLPFCLTTF